MVRAGAGQGAQQPGLVARGLGQTRDPILRDGDATGAAGAAAAADAADGGGGPAERGEERFAAFGCDRIPRRITEADGEDGGSAGGIRHPDAPTQSRSRRAGGYGGSGSRRRR